MFNGYSVIFYFPKGINSYFKVDFNKIICDFNIAGFCFYTRRNHWLIRNKQEGSCGNFISKSDSKNCCSFHINGHGPCFNEVFFKSVIIFPDPSVCSIYCACPVLPVKPGDGGRYCTLKLKSRQSRHFIWKIIIRCPVASYCCNRQDQIT